MTVDEVTNNTKQESQGSRRRRNREAAAAQNNASQAARKPAPTRRETASKGNFLTRFFRGIANYFSSTRAEIQKVTWPTRKESLRLSGIVLAVTVVSSIALGLVDYIYGEVFRIGLNAPTVFGIAALVLAIAVVGFTVVNTRRT